MNTNEVAVIHYDDAVHREQVVALWQEVFNYPASYNAPEFAIDKKIAHDNLFFVAVDNDKVFGTIMAGYDGHRGWIYSMAVRPGDRESGIGSMLLGFAEQVLAQLGCFKINLQILAGNEAVRKFYEANGYTAEERLSMGKEVKGE